MSLIYLPGLGCTYSQHENENKIYLPPSPGPVAAVISVSHTSPSLAPFLPFMNHLSAEVNVKKKKNQKTDLEKMGEDVPLITCSIDVFFFASAVHWWEGQTKSLVYSQLECKFDRGFPQG